MSNMKIISIMDAENKLQTMALNSDLQLAITLIEDELMELRAEVQNQINELKQRVAALEGVGP
jgi:hypothetical protein